MNGKRMHRTTISLTNGVAEALQREAHLRSTSASAVVREALEAYLAVGTAPRKRLAFVGLVRSG